MEGFILEISHVIIRKFHIYMPEDRPYEITIVQNKFNKEKGKVTVLRKMPDELILFTEPEYSEIMDMVKKELEK